MRKDDFDPDEFETEENQRAKNTEYKLNKGNTLDYYNEDLSRKAVGRLFEEKTENRNENSGSFVKGYHDELYQEDIKKPLEDEPGAQGEDQETGPIEKNKSFVKGYVKVSAQRNAPQKATSAYRPMSKPPSHAKEPLSKIPTAEDEEANDAFSLYRKKEKKNEVHARPAVKVTKDHASDSKPIKKPLAKTEAEAPEEQESGDYDDFRERYKNREYIPSPNQPQSTRKTAPDGADAPDYYDDYEDSPGSPFGLKIILGVVCLVFLIILAFLVYQINAANAQLKDAQAAISTESDTEKELQEHKIKNEDLEAQLAALREELELYKNSSADPSTGETPDGQASDQPEQAPADAEESYVVQSGDTLSKISGKFYDDQSLYRKIIDANNLTSDSLTPGQVLRIPPK